MKKNYIAAAALATSLALSITACGSQAVTSTISSTVTSSKSTSSSETASKTSNVSSTSTSTSTSSSVKSGDEKFTDRDLNQTPDLSDAKYITVSDSSTIDITSEGTYVISGNASNCTIKVNADENAKVQIVLDGVNVTNTDFPVIYVVEADKVFVTTTSNSSNTLSVTGQFRADGDTNTDAVIFSKQDIVLNGTGTLNITSTYGNGVTGKDDMKITGGTYNVKTLKDGFEANDSLLICDGVFNVTSSKDCFHCENDETEGNIIISGGSFKLTGASDGIQACAMLEIDGGSFNITAPEGLEGTYIVINDGDITISASDDGINVSNGTKLYDTAIVINGGNLNVAVGQGDTDAIDANGSITVNGGYINITCQMSSFDYDTSATYNGGTIIINGQEVNSIPVSTMGGGMRGGRGGF